jgi:8-oxo-dGTP diphosphatase
VSWAGACRRRPPCEHSDIRWITADELDHLEWIAADRPLIPAVRALLARL